MNTDRDLVFTRDIATPRSKLYRCWTKPAPIKQGFAPAPWTTAHAEADVRVGAASLTVMRGPDRHEFPNPSVYLDLEANERIVATDAHTSAWEPSAKPFMTLVPTFDDLGGGRMRYTARTSHWTVSDREAHEKMGFDVGWGRCTDQLAEPAAWL